MGGWRGLWFFFSWIYNQFKRKFSFASMHNHVCNPSLPLSRCLMWWHPGIVLRVVPGHRGGRGGDGTELDEGTAPLHSCGGRPQKSPKSGYR